jgi:hypothetical protein
MTAMGAELTFMIPRAKVCSGVTSSKAPHEGMSS